MPLCEETAGQPTPNAASSHYSGSNDSCCVRVAPILPLFSQASRLTTIRGHLSNLRLTSSFPVNTDATHCMENLIAHTHHNCAQLFKCLEQNPLVTQWLGRQ